MSKLCRFEERQIRLHHSNLKSKVFFKQHLLVIQMPLSIFKITFFLLSFHLHELQLKAPSAIITKCKILSSTFFRFLNKKSILLSNSNV